MRFKKLVALGCLILIVSIACSPDDGNFSPAPERDRAEQQLVDNDSLLGFFATHYYNASTFEGGGEFSMEDIVITELPKDDDGNYLDLPDPDNNRLLSVELENPDGILKAFTTTFQETEYIYYVMNINQGGGAKSPNFTDDVRVRYEGSLQDASIFDSAITPTEFDLVGLSSTSGTIQGWRVVLPQFNEAASFNTNNGNVIFNDFGLGVMFLPSGLGFYSSPLIGIPVYSNLIFKFELLQTEENDHDNDGVPSYLEDFDGEGGSVGDLNLFNDDTDEDNIPNYLDNDDDGDGVLTINEDINNDGDPTNDDSDGDGIPNYLDADSTESNDE